MASVLNPVCAATPPLPAVPAVRPADGLELRFGLDIGQLAYAYCRWRAEWLFHLIFHRSPDMTLEQFLDWNYSPSTEPIGVYAGEALIGIGWICQAREVNGQVVAEVGAAFFRGTPLAQWHRGLDLLMQHAFVDRGFAAVYGTSSIRNRAARIIVKRCGMEKVDRLPWPEEVDEETVIHALDWMTWAKRSNRNG